MPGTDQVKQILSKLISEDRFLPGDDLSEEVSSIICYTDIFECGCDKIVSRHIDMDFTFGDYLELHEGEPLFQYVCELYSLEIAGNEPEAVILYQKQFPFQPV